MHLVDSAESEEAAWLYLKNQPVLAIDFEWQPDLRGENNPLSIAQVGTLERCYVWCLFLFDGPCGGLQDLLQDQNIKKVGCGLRTNDLKKLETTGYELPHYSDLPPGFEDVQDYKYRGAMLPWKNLKYLVKIFCQLDFVDKKLDLQSVNWTRIHTDVDMLKYAVLDVYAVMLIYEENKKLLELQSSSTSTESKVSVPRMVDGVMLPLHEYQEIMAIAMTGEMKTQFETCQNERYSVSLHPINDRNAPIDTQNSAILRFEDDDAGEHLYPGAKMLIFDSPLCDPKLDLVGAVTPMLIDGVYYLPNQLEDILKLGIEIGGRVYSAKRDFNPVPFQRQLRATEDFTVGLNPMLQRIILGSNETVPLLLGNIEDNSVTEAAKLGASPSLLRSSSPSGSSNHDWQKMQKVFDDVKTRHPMNDSQKEAVYFSLRRPFAMIHGPPGTGKTHTLTSLIYYIVKTQPTSHRILVCAPSNEATDHLARNIVASTGLLPRTGLDIIKSYARQDGYRKEDTIYNYIWHQPSMEELKKMQKNSSGPFDPPMPHARVICCTLSMSGSKSLVDQKFDYVVIDEASQCVETECLIAIGHGAQQLILAGDHKQLGPVVLSQQAREAQLDRSLFERLIETQSANGVQLNVQYRMHPRISEWPNMNFYNSSIKDGVTEAQRKLPHALEKIIASASGSSSIVPRAPMPSPNIFIHIPGVCTKTRNGSSGNVAEAEIALLLFSTMIRVGVGKVVVLTPYQGQCGLINTMARARNLPGFQSRPVAQTISQFQGQEAEVVILSLVRSLRTEKRRGTSTVNGVSGGIGFTAEPKRINVGLTRAKNSLIVLGDVQLLKMNDLWASALQYYETQESLFELTPGEAKTLSLDRLKSSAGFGIVAGAPEPEPEALPSKTNKVARKAKITASTSTSASSIENGAEQNGKTQISSSAPSSSRATNSHLSTTVTAGKAEWVKREAQRAQASSKKEIEQFAQTMDRHGGLPPTAQQVLSQVRPQKKFYRKKKGDASTEKDKNSKSGGLPGHHASTHANATHVQMLQSWLKQYDFADAVYKHWEHKKSGNHSATVQCCLGRMYAVQAPSRNMAVYGAAYLALSKLDTAGEYFTPTNEERPPPRISLEAAWALIAEKYPVGTGPEHPLNVDLRLLSQKSVTIQKERQKQLEDLHGEMEVQVREFGWYTSAACFKKHPSQQGDDSFYYFLLLQDYRTRRLLVVSGCVGEAISSFSDAYTKAIAKIQSLSE